MMLNLLMKYSSEGISIYSLTAKSHPQLKMAEKIRNYPNLSLFLSLSLLSLLLTRAAASPPSPSPSPWPLQFHSILFINASSGLQVTDLWYDWPNGRNFNIIQHQLAKKVYDLEWNNGTSFYYTLDSTKQCTTMYFPVGIPRPDFLDGADYLGQHYRDGFLCNLWEKVDFIWYYEDVLTNRPVAFDFYSGLTNNF